MGGEAWRERVERVTSTQRRFLRRRQHTSEEAELTDAAAVRRWVRDLDSDHDQTILVQRVWGVVAGVQTHEGGRSVVLSTDGDSFEALPAGVDELLTLDQFERVLVDALTTDGPPDWIAWHRL